jgi:hypothetical protein
MVYIRLQEPGIRSWIRSYIQLVFRDAHLIQLSIAEEIKEAAG